MMTLSLIDSLITMRLRTVPVVSIVDTLHCDDVLVITSNYILRCEIEIYCLLQLASRTYSLWGHVASHVDEFVNPLYQSGAYPELLIPNLSPANILFWRGLYCRFESGVHPRESIADILLATRYVSYTTHMH